MNTLYELTEAYKNLIDMADDESVDEEALRDTLEALTDSIENKLEGVAVVLKTMESEVNGIEAEMSELKRRAQIKKNRIESLKDYLILNMTLIDKKKFETSKAYISLPKPKSSVDVDSEHFITWAMENRDDLLRYKAPEPDKTKIKEALLKGEEIVGAGLVYKQTITIR